jgi:ABC-2 type transport system permease protein
MNLGIARGSWVIAKRELQSLFVSPIAYVALSGFAVLAGWFFFNLLAQFQEMTSVYMQLAMQRPDILQQINLSEMVIQPTWMNLTVILVILFPILTMRLVAEERRQRTDELLLTSPVSTGAIVLGKYMAIMTVYAAMLAMTLSFPLVLVIWAARRRAGASF